MKKSISVLILALVSAGVVSACVKKAQPVAASPAQTVIIVMDTTQALLNEAEVKVGKTTYKTSFDGRVVLKPEQTEGVKALSVSCEGFEAKKIALDGSAVLLVRLTPKPGSASKSGGVYGYRTGSRAEARYAKDVVTLAATADYVMTEEAAVEASVMETPSAVVAYGGVANSPVSAGKLTAGEVNDFAKWYFWPTVLDSTHRRFVGTWRIEARERYTVQVVNKNGYPVANYPVNLTDAKGNTLFQAITDNTGKAELWNGLMSEGLRVTGDRLRVQGYESPLKRDGLNTIVLDEPCEAPDAVDVVFVFDATGSMGDELHYLQAEMKDVIARAKDATGGLNIRTGAVVYRDHSDEYLTRISRLTDDITVTQAFIDKQEANGGGDYEEAVPEALMAALNSAGWNEQARARIAFLILDAPCHQDSATLALLHEQILNAAALGVRIVPVVCSGLGESGEYLLRSMALATNGTSFFLTDDSGIGLSHLKPTTDSLKVEHLNDMLVRTIVEFSFMPGCAQENLSDEQTENDRFVPNPFSKEDLEQHPEIPHGEGVHYLIDVSGKLLGIFYGDVKTSDLPIGVYFVKTFYDGQWFTEKILVH